MPIQLTLIYGISALLSFALGHIVLLNDIRSPMRRSFYAFTMVQFLWISSLYLGYFFVFKENPNPSLSVIFIKLAYGFGILMLPLISGFFYYFPRVTFRLSAAWRYFFLLLILGIFSVSSFSNLVHDSQVFVNGVYVADKFGSLYIYYIILSVLFLISAGSVAAQKTVTLVGIDKQKILFSAVGCWIFLFLTASTNVILPLFHIYQIGSFQLIMNSPLYSLFFIIPTFYSIHRYRFFNFSNASLNIIRTIITYFLYLSVMVMIYLLQEGIVDHGVLRGIISSLLALMIFKYVENRIPKLVVSSFREFKNVINELRGKIYYSNSYDELRALIEKLFCLRLNFVSAKVYFIRKNTDSFNLPVYKANQFSKNLALYGKDGLAKNELDFKKLKSDVRGLFKQEMERMEMDLCIPLFSENNLIGFFALKQKNSNQPYSKDAMNELLSLKKALSVTLMNILLKLNLEEENNLMKAIIDKKTKQLKKKIQEVNELVQQQSDFIAITAHEFRTPLSIASFQMEDILGSEMDLKTQLQELQVINSSLNNLKQLTEKLFAVQQYDLNKVEFKPEKTELKAFMTEIYNEFSHIMKEQKLKFTLKIDLTHEVFSEIDRLQIRQVMHNLLKNASKFTPEKGSIELALRENKNKIFIEVSDSGGGIPDILKKSVFEKFRTKTDTGGIGLGLYLCKKIIQLHKGKIWVVDNEQGGARFCIELNPSKK